MQVGKQVGVVICTHNRVKDARINQEIIRSVWQEKSTVLKDAVIIHSYNGKSSWYPQHYLENDIVRTANSNLSQGNADLIDHGINFLHQQYPEIKYCIVLNADTWLIKPKFIENLICEMEARDLLMAASSYVGEKSEFFRGGLSSDFFIVNVPFAIHSGMIPLRYKEFQQKYWDLILYYSADMAPILEKLLFARFADALYRTFPSQNPADVINTRLLRIKEREPFYKSGSDIERIWYWPEAGVLSSHDFEGKKQVLLKENLSYKGKYLDLLLKTDPIQETIG